jgi:hypothetical protein
MPPAKGYIRSRMAALVNALNELFFEPAWVMAKEKSKGEELSTIGKQTMAHAYSAMDYYFDHLKKTVASAPSGGTEFGEKVRAYAEQNISATREYVRELTYAKDTQDIFRIQMEFVRSQLEAFGEQVKDLGEAYIKAASGQTKKPFS